ncbi:hypothetical protein [Lactococcus lactis]|uniref:hypothetical protein n=1 Tax=Lactococcus lactis TaxID=1358 RepID=UPI001455F4D9|nr:hypothetical protein [Lactococcus lactis]
MKKTILWSATFLSLFALAACSNSKSSENQTKKENTSSSKVTSSSKTSNSKNSATHSTNTSPSSSQANTNNSEKVQKSSSPLSGYSAEQVEYARVTETLLSYYKYDYQPVSISVTKNGANHQVFPFSGSVVVPQDTVTLSFSSDNTMAGTTIVTYSSNHNRSINFYKDPNHYQDERYLKDSAWVKEESQKLLDSSQTLAIPTSFDEQAAQIISKIEIK